MKETSKIFMNEIKAQVDSDKEKEEKRNAAPQKHCMGDK